MYNQKLNSLETIETERLILRPFNLNDIEPSYELNLDPEITRYTNDGGVKSYETIKYLIQDVVMGDYEKHGFGRFAVDLKDNNEFIGFTGLKYIPELDEVDLGYRFKRKYWGMGIATESGIASLKFGFETLDLKEIIAMALPGNIGSIRVLEKLNFHLTEQFEEENILINKYLLKNPKKG